MHTLIHHLTRMNQEDCTHAQKYDCKPVSAQPVATSFTESCYTSLLFKDAGNYFPRYLTDPLEQRPWPAQAVVQSFRRHRGSPPPVPTASQLTARTARGIADGPAEGAWGVARPVRPRSPHPTKLHASVGNGEDRKRPRVRAIALQPTLGTP